MYVCPNCFDISNVRVMTDDDGVAVSDTYQCVNCGETFKITRGLEPGYWRELSNRIRSKLNFDRFQRVEIGPDFIAIYRYNTEFVRWTWDELKEDFETVRSAIYALLYVERGIDVEAILKGCP